MLAVMSGGHRDRAVCASARPTARKQFSLQAPRSTPLRTGRCRVRCLRSCFTIATFPGKSPAG